MKKFVHLHCHTDMSLLDGASRIPDLAKRVKSLGMDAVAITDHGNMRGCVQFLAECKGAGVKPVVGVEAYHTAGFMADRSGGRDSHHLTLLAKTGEGVRNLMRLSSRAFLEGFYYTPRIDAAALQKHSKGVICLSGCVSSLLSDHLLKGRQREAKELAGWYARVFKKNFYVEIQDNGVGIQREVLPLLVDLADRMGLPLVATSDAHYLERGDHVPHDILLCINTHKNINDPDRMRFDTDQFHVRGPDEMYAAMPAYGEAVARSAEIADGVEEDYPSLGLGRRQFPVFDCPKGGAAGPYLRELCEAGLARYGGRVPDGARERLEYELEVICKMGFETYFLVVWDFVRFAREKGIPVSARGSAGGAIVSYLLYISHFCPIEHGLLFERFLDPNRSDPPDIDIDICKDRREEVVAYVTGKYGAGNVSRIGTVNTLAPRVAIKDVGKALGVDFARLGRVTDLIPQKLGTTLAGTYEGVAEFRTAVDGDKEIKKVYENALRIEGTAKSAGIHAAGVVIAPRPLIDTVPLQRDRDGVVSTQWTMGDLEKAGLLKMDFLGLRNMTMLSYISNMTGIGDFYGLPLDDGPTFELLRRGDCRGVFQLDGGGIRELLVRVKPDRFGDIVAVLAMYRPGPLEGGMVDDYIDVKHGRKEASYVHPVVKEVLEPTYGVMVYQEQIMSILNRLGGLELSRAYACIKAISKKKPDQVAKFRAEFESGAAKTVGPKVAKEVFELIAFFAGYGFNKCISGDTRIRRYGANAGSPRAPFTVEEMYRIRNDAAYAKDTNHYDLHKKWRHQRHYGNGLSLCDDGRVRQNRILDIQEAGVRPVFKITVEGGAAIRVTDNHKFPTPNGERRASQLRVGDPLLLCGEYEQTTTKYGWSNLTREDIAAKSVGLEGGVNGEANYHYTNGSFTKFNNFKYSTADVCATCGKDGGRIEVHHIDGDRTNSEVANLVKLCPSCHKKREYAAGRVKRGGKGYPSFAVKIVSIEPDGECMTYDVTMEAPNHTFTVDSGIITCNSHSTAYAYLAYQTAYVKAHHPREFMAALLSSEMTGAERGKYFAEHLAECRRLGVGVLPPDINKSGYGFVCEDDPGKGGCVRFGLAAVAGVGADVVAGLVADREARGPFRSLGDLTARVPLEKSRVEAFILAGALDGFGRRGPLIAATKASVKFAKVVRKDAKRGQGRLFDDTEAEESPLPDVRDLTVAEVIEAEKEILGVCVSHDPFDQWGGTLAKMSTCTCLEMKERRGRVVLGVVVSEFRTKLILSKGQYRTMMTAVAGDLTGSVRVVVWPDSAAACADLREGWCGFLVGDVEHGRGSPQLVAVRAVPVERGEQEFSRGIVVYLPTPMLPGQIERFQRVMRSNPGPVQVYIDVNGETYKAGAGGKVRIDDDLIRSFEGVVGPGAVRVLGAER